MPRNCLKYRKWSQREKEIFSEIVLNNKKMLIENFYSIILKGAHTVRKRNGFFKQMKKQLKRDSTLCKSKFQKDEKKIYVNLLKVPENHYELFSFLRRKKKTNKKKKHRDSERMYQLQKNIIEKIEFFGFEYPILIRKPY